MSQSKKGGAGFTNQQPEKKSSYVQALLQKSKQILEQATSDQTKEQLLESARKMLKKRMSRESGKTGATSFKKKTLTVAAPFELRT